MMNRFKILTLVLLTFTLVSGSIMPAVVYAAPVTGFEPGRIIDDDVFTQRDSMTVAQIQQFLNSKVPVCDTMGTQPSEFGGGTRAQYGTSRGYPPPYTCLKDYSQGGLSAAQIIYNSAQFYKINPQVMLVLLQKENGLVTDTWPFSSQYRTATGYGCPDTAPCDTEYYGFKNQVEWANRMYRKIMDADPLWYTPYIMGNNSIRWHPNVACGSSTVNITTRATQALYNYTPYRPNQAALSAGYGTGDSCSSYGNRNFYQYFKDWFGSTWGNSYYTCRYGNNLAGVPTGQKIVRSRFPGYNDLLTLVVPNNTGSGCAEVHTWSNSNFQGWIQHIGTNSFVFNPTRSTVISAHISKSSTRLFKVDYTGTASGKLEIHGWAASVQHWVSHVATASRTVDPTTSEIISADGDGNGVSEFFLINYSLTGSGMVEVHGLTSDMQGWFAHKATALPAIDTTKGRIIAADLNGDGRDELSYIKFADTGSGFVELHTFSPTLQGWVRHTATNLPVSNFNNATDQIVAAETNADERDELFFIRYSGTQSGRVEIHGWTSDMRGWVSHAATSQSAF